MNPNGLSVERSNEYAAAFARLAARPHGRRLVIHVGRLKVQVARLDGRWYRSAAWVDYTDLYAALLRYPSVKR